MPWAMLAGQASGGHEVRGKFGARNSRLGILQPGCLAEATPGRSGHGSAQVAHRIGMSISLGIPPLRFQRQRYAAEVYLAFSGVNLAQPLSVAAVRHYLCHARPRDVRGNQAEIKDFGLRPRPRPQGWDQRWNRPYHVLDMFRKQI